MHNRIRTFDMIGLSGREGWIEDVNCAEILIEICLGIAFKVSVIDVD